VPVLVVAVAVLGTWYLVRRWNGSKGPDAAKRMAGVLRAVWKGVLVVAALGVLAAMAQGCEGNQSSGGSDPRSGPPCTTYHAPDCTPGLGSTTTMAAPGLESRTDPRHQPCPAFHEEDCPLGVSSGS
jgi:hypothetical protein